MMPLAKSKPQQAHADPESFVRGGPNLMGFFLLFFFCFVFY